MIVQPFAPSYGSTQTFTPAAASSAAVQIDIIPGNKQVRVANAGLNVCFFRLGKSDVSAATTADMPVLPGAVVTVTKGDATHIRHISALGTTLYLTLGEGWM